MSDVDNWEPVSDNEDSTDSVKQLGPPFEHASNNDNAGDTEAESLQEVPLNTETNDVRKNLVVITNQSAADEHPTEIKHDQSRTSSTSSFFSGMISSFKSNVPSPVSRSTTPTSPVSQPSIISHRREPSMGSKRRSSRRISNATIAEIGSPLQQVEKPDEVKTRLTPSQMKEDNYDHRRFVEERYMDTPYHYASEQRNKDFHETFKSVPKDDRLLDDFNCGLNRELLYQGKLYITETHLCFNSNVLGWIAKVLIAFEDVTFMEKTSAAGLFPSAISIETKMGKTLFNGFISRDAAFGLMKEVWSRTLLQKDMASENINTKAEKPGNGKEIDDAINSIDEENNDKDANDNDTNENDDENISTNETTPNSTSSSPDKEKEKAYKLRADSSYQYDGPIYHHSTSFPAEPMANNEFVLKELPFDCAPGILFEVMFNSEQNEFLLDFLRGQEGSQITTIPNFTSIDGSSMTLKREYSYEKALHFPAGPKSTTCYVAEVIKRKDPDTYYEVISSIRTPNVPSGGSFSTKTRYLIRWNDEITCLLRVSFWVEWTGSSWIKGMVENGCKNGQLEAAQLMERILSKFIKNNVEECQITISKEEEEQDDKEVKNKLKEVDLEQPREAVVTAPAIAEQQGLKVTMETWLFLYLIVVVLLLFNLFYIRSIAVSLHQLVKLQLVELKL
ncbi:BAD_collapsed_G0016850.mRNA.1.CDS.1 [Saccharomyces cerevisiae]|nr:BAD_HP_G0013050.mRNA.1.CDS.1 [Saccharomyces cerevisiae]CAI4985330.1 BAD_HP_G0054470.mRNA.1.CDS.1 [Saccharomyces cerevisiae]CAI6459043.1 BAD_HP_G0013050.mRNA.1.CDS.1 [Saccharomyces cerevisiae]CAI6841361.1 BAD_HP_G0054470.mRNA.1.CDS.1 [Saccharomyces cerevisiae]CAI7275010.1 BAD_collapsed_G0016850.mRNA.1.CDS.1 [Saccharomyces cerevisiae]